MALRVSLEWGTLPRELQDLPADGSQEGGGAGARAVTGRRSFAMGQKSSHPGRLRPITL